MKVPYVYLRKQFAKPGSYLRDLEKIAKRGDFTLGREVRLFEKRAASLLGAKFAIGVGNGTDALYLSLKALGIGPDDEVITAPNSFVATAAAIALTGARPVFADVLDDYTIDPALIEKAVTKKSKIIIPVHLTGQPCDMGSIMAIAQKYNLFVVEDAAQAFLAKYDGKYLGTLGTTGAFSFHPLKILHVWGDGGLIVTNDEKVAVKLRLWRNHGLKTRNEVEFFANNSRLDTIHAAIALRMLGQLPGIVKKRQQIAAEYDRLIKDLAPHVRLPARTISQKPIAHTFTNYVVMCARRDELIAFLAKKGIEAVVQYPTPIHLLKAARYLGYKKGDFPVCEKQADTIVTFPCNQYMTTRDVEHVAHAIKEFYD